jgi:hypothetical protein
MKRIWIGLLLAAGLSLAAQDATKKEKMEQAQKAAASFPQKSQVQRLFILKYADPSQLMNLLSVFDAKVRPNADMHALAVEASGEAMRAIEDAIQKLDVPSAMPKNIEMTVFLLVATDSGTPAGSAIPKDLDDVATQLKNTFPFKNYGLLDVLTFRTRTGQSVSTTSSGGSFQIGGRPVSVISSLRINSISVESDGSTVRIDKMNSDYRVPVQNGAAAPNDYSYQNLGLQTDLDIKEGQKVVVGRLGISHDQALFLVMMAKVL